ncbi:DMT family transporter [Paracoccus sp. XHP0099]|uniref:DMT family transporter n=2 Tax=Paracoccus marinaquae TaxID=2841926 RepID=A0ABS6ADI8_9RHOB|nr:DMT family transporter [Paracoccus marinaquae]
MTAAMGVFAIEDALVKAASAMMPVGQILIIFGLGGALVFACLARLGKAPLFSREVVSRPMLVRMVFEIVGRLFYVLAIALIPLSTATVILQATPLVVVAGATVIFGEKVGWRRLTAILVGLAGVLIILQPGTEGFSMLSVLAVIGMIGFAGRDLASRAAPRSLATSVLGLYGFLSVAVAGVLFAIWQGAAFVPITGEAALILSGAVLAGVGAYACLMKAMRTGEVSAVTPFRYTRLLFGIGFGILFFGERLSFSMLIGSGLIVASGLVILWRSRSQRAPK